MRYLVLVLLFCSTQLYSGIGIGESNVKPLPVELISFNASINENGVNLDWTTISEINNFGFQIERAILNLENNLESEYIILGFVQGGGNSNSQKHYTFRDASIISGKFIYRLKQIDTDGKYRYLKSMEVSFNIPSEYQLFQNFPNPFNPSTTISYTLPYESNVTIKIFNSLGNEVASIVNERQTGGSYSKNFNAGNLASGVYFYRIEAISVKNGSSFIAARKMTILK